jgi:hypothetical protein
MLKGGVKLYFRSFNTFHVVDVIHYNIGISFLVFMFFDLWQCHGAWFFRVFNHIFLGD